MCREIKKKKRECVLRKQRQSASLADCCCSIGMETEETYIILRSEKSLPPVINVSADCFVNECLNQAEP